jgi:succinate dehydrogenase / fumarate reductase iron-sulfur subunit
VESKAFPVIKDLVVDRDAFDRVISAVDLFSVNTGNAQDANALPIAKEAADDAFSGGSMYWLRRLCSGL